LEKKGDRFIFVGQGSQTVTFTHDNANRLTGFTDAYGKNISYGYDPVA